MRVRALLEEVRATLEREAWAELAALAQQERRSLTVLVALTYDSDAQVADRAIRGFGVAARAAAALDEEFVRGHLLRLLWLMWDESGGICWRGPELLGEVLAVEPVRFAAFMPIFAALLDTEPQDAERFRESWERATVRVREAGAVGGSG